MSRLGTLRLVAWLAAAVLISPPTALTAQTPDPLRTDWANLARYRDDNMKLGPPKPGEQRVVFMGNSITEAWANYFPTMFPGKPYVGRGISGQTTPQMLVRFRQDVIALKPAVVVILGGTNDIAGNTGPSTLEMIEDNLASMTELAQANGIRVVLSSVLPVFDYPWKPGLEPAPKIVALNGWVKEYAAKKGAVYLDYHSAMADERQGMRRELSEDGVHPNEAGYRVMAPLAEQAIAEALVTADVSAVRRELLQRYDENRRALLAKDFNAVMALRTEDFHAMTPDSVRHDRAEMEQSTHALLDGIDRWIGLTFDVDSLEVSGDLATAVVRQHADRMARRSDGLVHHVETWVTQHEIWRRTAAGWKLYRVDSIHDQRRLIDGQPG